MARRARFAIFTPPPQPTILFTHYHGAPTACECGHAVDSGYTIVRLRDFVLGDVDDWANWEEFQHTMSDPRWTVEELVRVFGGTTHQVPDLAAPSLGYRLAYIHGIHGVVAEPTDPAQQGGAYRQRRDLAVPAAVGESNSRVIPRVVQCTFPLERS